MRCVQVVSAAALRRLYSRVRQPVGAASSPPTAEVFAAPGYHFTRALRQANARAWFALEVFLAGESVWERAQLDWERDLDDDFFHPLRLFLDGASETTPILTDPEARAAARADVQQAARAGLLASGMLDIPDLARQVQDAADAEPVDADSPRQLIEDWDNAGLHSLRPILTLTHADGTPLLILLVAAFFRRALQLDADLFGELAEVDADVDDDEALEDAHLWAALFQDHRPRLEALLKELATAEHRPSGAAAPAGDAAERLERGLAHAQRGQHEAAIGEYSVAIQLDPGLVEAFAARGEMHRLKGNYAQALDDLNTALRLQPSNSQALFARGQVHWLLRRHAAAIHDFTAHLERHPASAVGYYFRGKARTEHGDLEAAVADFNEAARLDPGHPWVFHDRGDAHAARADFERAILDYSQALRLNPHAAISCLRRAEAYSAQGEFRKAVADYTEVLRLDPLNSAAYLGRGTAYRRLSRWAEAAQDFSRALEHDETNPQLFYQRGLLYQQSGDYERAVQDLDAAIGLDPADAELHYQRGRAHAAFGAEALALADLNEAVRLNPRHTAAWHCRGMVHAARGAAAEALSDFSAVLRLDPERAEAYAGRARILSRMGLHDDALLDCDAALQRDPRIVEAYLVRGSALGRKGDYERAVGDFSEALQLEPENAQAYFLRGLARHGQGKLSEALADLSAVLRLDQRNARAFVHRAAVLQAAQQNERALCDLAHAVRLDQRYAATYCRQLGLVHQQREEYERAVADFSLVLMLEPDNHAARTLRNQAWKSFVAQRRGKPPARPEKQLGAAALAGMTNLKLAAVGTMMSAAEQALHAAMDPADPAAGAAPGPHSDDEAAHENLPRQRTQELQQQVEEDRKQKMAEFQQKLADAKKATQERIQKAQARVGRRHVVEDDPDRMPLWKRGILVAAACIAVWFLGSWGLEIYANYRAQAPFTLARFCRDFEQDALQARKKYDGGAFELTGKAKIVYTGRETRLALETPEVPQWSVHCRFDLSPDSFKKLVADQIEPGQLVTIEGRCSYQPKEGKGIILMEECILRKSG